MAIAFAGVALLVGLTLGFKKIEKPSQNGDVVIDEEKKTEGGNASEAHDQNVDDNKHLKA